VVAVSGVSKAYGELPFSSWIDASASVSFEYSTVVSGGSSGKQYILANVNAPSPWTITNPTTITGSYKTQYRVTLVLLGLESDVIYGNDPFYGPSSAWVDGGDLFTFECPDTLRSAVEGKRYVLANVSTTSPLTIAAPSMINAVYATQYQVSFSVDPAESGRTSPSNVASIWVNAGAIPVSATANTGYKFSSWTATGSIALSSASSNSTTATVNGAGTVTANFSATPISGNPSPLTFGVAAVIVVVSVAIVFAFVRYKRRQRA
jgi:hypothetical protein